MSIRSEVADLIRAGVPANWTVRAFEYLPDQAYPPVVMVRIGNQTPLSRFGQRACEVVVTVCLSPSDTPERSEDALEAALDILLVSLLDAPDGVVGTATRMTLDNRLNAYEVTLSIIASLERN